MTATNIKASSPVQGASPDVVVDAYRVLVVDDSAVTRGLIARACESHPAIKVTATAGNGDLPVKGRMGQS